MSSRLNVGSCQNEGPFLGTLNIRCRIISRDPNIDNHPRELQRPCCPGAACHITHSPETLPLEADGLIRASTKT